MIRNGNDAILIRFWWIGRRMTAGSATAERKQSFPTPPEVRAAYVPLVRYVVMVRPRYELPGSLRPATLADRRSFFASRMDYDAGLRWFAGMPGERVFALIIGRHSGIYPRRFRSLKNVPLLVEDVRDPPGLRPYLLKYLPEGVYYDRNAYASVDSFRGSGADYARPWRSRWFLGQELAFDLDPENLDCPIHGDIDAKMRRHQGLSFCDWEFTEVRRQAANLHDILAKRWSDLFIVYSGRGFHIHVFDEEAFRLSKTQRARIASRFGRRYAIDEWVTSGEMRLIRMPYSLHGMVNRVVIPVPRRGLDTFRYDDRRADPGSGT